MIAAINGSALLTGDSGWAAAAGAPPYERAIDLITTGGRPLVITFAGKEAPPPATTGAAAALPALKKGLSS